MPCANGPGFRWARVSGRRTTGAGDDIDMGSLKEFRRRERTTVAAVRLDLETEGFTYRKWGGPQQCKGGDWIVHSGDDTYTVDAEVFSRTYRAVSRGVYEKVSPVWAARADTAGAIQTKEGFTPYQGGDMLVFNDPDGRDGYAMSKGTFDSLYEPVDP
jgi:hypothetical protein